MPFFKWYFSGLGQYVSIQHFDKHLEDISRDAASSCPILYDTCLSSAGSAFLFKSTRAPPPLWKIGRGFHAQIIIIDYAQLKSAINFEVLTRRSRMIQ